MQCGVLNMKCKDEKMLNQLALNMEYSGVGIPIDLCIASLILQQITSKQKWLSRFTIGIYKG